MRTSWFGHPKCKQCRELNPEDAQQCVYCGTDLGVSP